MLNTEKADSKIKAHAKDDQPEKNALLFYSTPREVNRPVIVSRNEVFCGPDCKTLTEGDHYRTIQTPVGRFDIRSVIAQLPPAQTPELIVVKTDATGRCFPTHLAGIDCPKLFILGGTHHLTAPIQTLIDYAAAERFDLIMSEHNRHHLHFFKEAGFDNTIWLPCFNLHPYEQPEYPKKFYKVSFVGQVGRHHPYGRHLLDFLKKTDVIVHHFKIQPAQAAKIYRQSHINLNISHNGDLNLRVFEVISAGGFLLTDRLSRESGLDRCFKDGKHFVSFENEADLLEKIRFYTTHPEKAAAIARSGYAHYKQHHTPEKKIAELMGCLFEGKENPLYEIRQDKRTNIIQPRSTAELGHRIAIYEFLQDLHQAPPMLSVLFWPDIDARIISDAVDLPRLIPVVKDDERALPARSRDLFQQMEIGGRIRRTSESSAEQRPRHWDVLVLPAQTLSNAGIEGVLSHLNTRWLVISDAWSSVGPARSQAIETELRQVGFERLAGRISAYYWKDRVQWGEVLFSLGKTEEAAACFEDVLRETPDHQQALNNLGVIAFQLNHLDVAEKFFYTSVSLNRRDADALFNLAQVYMQSDRFAEAARLLEAAVAIDAAAPGYRFYLGICHEMTNRQPEAWQAFERCVSLGESQWAADAAKRLPGDYLPPGPRASSGILSPRKILVLTNLYPPQELGGYGRLLSDFGELLSKRGHEIHVLTSDTAYLKKIHQTEPRVNRNLILFGEWSEGACQRISDQAKIDAIGRHNRSVVQQTIHNLKPDLCLLGNLDFISPLVLDPLMAEKIPTIHHVGNMKPGYEPSDTPSAPWYHMATASRWLRDTVRAQGYPLPDISVVYPGAFVQDFKAAVLPDMGKLRIAFAGILLPYKGPQYLNAALKTLHDRGVDFTCTFAGQTLDDGFLNNQKKFVEITGMNEKVTFPGNLTRESLKDLFGRSNVLVFPSIFQEPFGISQVEAMAAGLAVITSGTGGAREIIEDGVSGLLCRPEDDASIAQALIHLDQHPDFWGRLARAGRERALEKFDIERAVDALEERFVHLLNLKG